MLSHFISIFFPVSKFFEMMFSLVMHDDVLIKLDYSDIDV